MDCHDSCFMESKILILSTFGISDKIREVVNSIFNFENLRLVKIEGRMMKAFHLT